MSHTPGPWSVESCEGTQGFDACIYDASHTSVVAESMMADARLIAAAPELLGALEELLEWAKPEPTSVLIEENEAALSIARAAIAKARSEW